MMAQLGERRGIKHGMKSAALAWRGMLEGTINPAKGESMTDQETIERVHVTADDIEASNDLIDFIEACPSMFHTAATIMAELDEAGFTYLPENAAWDIEPGGRYYTQRNTSSVVAFKVGEDLAATWGEDGVAGDYHFQLTASHSDSPTFKVKAVPELDGAGETLRLNTEAYGGMIDYLVRSPAGTCGPRAGARGRPYREPLARYRARSCHYPEPCHPYESWR